MNALFATVGFCIVPGAQTSWAQPPNDRTPSVTNGLKADTSKRHAVLTNDGIKHDFEVYAGTHTSDVAVRFQEHVVPFLSRTLSFEPVKNQSRERLP